MRQVFGTAPRRADHEQAAIIAIQNLKAELASPLLQLTSRNILRSRATVSAWSTVIARRPAHRCSATNPDLDLDAEEDTLFGYLFNGLTEVPDRVVRDTHFDGLKLIPANLELFEAEYALAGMASARGEGNRRELSSPD